MIEESNKFCAQQIVHDRQTIFYSMIHPMRINSYCLLSTISAYFQSRKLFFDKIALHESGATAWQYLNSIRILFSLFLVYFTKFARAFPTQRFQMNEKYHRKTMKMLRFCCFHEEIIESVSVEWNLFCLL